MSKPDKLPEADNALYKQANSYLEANDPANAEAILLDLTERFPHLSNVWGLLGVCYYDELRFEKAYATFRNIREKANNPSFCSFKTGFLDLLAGDYKNGWELYTNRRRQPMPIPPLSSQNANSFKHLLVLREQGYGDIIQFARFLYPLRNYFPGRKISFLCPPPMLRSLSKLAHDLNIQLIQKLPEEEIPLYDFDAYTHICSLPIHLGYRKDQVGLSDNFLLYNKKETQDLRPLLKKPAIGFCWTGRKGYPRFYNRDCPNKDALTILEAFPEIEFISLMKPDVELPDGVEELYDHPRLNCEYIKKVRDFYDLTTLIAALDAVVTVDSAPLHVAATLGKPTYSLIGYAPDWRWMMGQTDSLWYRSCQLFRQTTPAQWEHVVEDVIEALHADLPNYPSQDE